jgi:hypothetical protein
MKGIFFNTAHNYTTNFKGEEQVVLCYFCCADVTANGNKLPTYVILNRDTVSKESVCKDVIIQVHEDIWITSELMKD